MNTKTSLIAVLVSASIPLVARSEPPLVPLPEPPARFAQKAAESEKPNATATPPKEVVPPPKDTLLAPSDDEFSSALSALRKELDEVRVVRQQTATSSSGGNNADFEGALSAVRQRRQLLEMLQKLATSGPKKSEARQQTKTEKKADTPEDEAAIQLDIGGQVNDPFGLGKSLFRLGDFARAEQAFRLVPNNGSNEFIMKYLIACCLRKQKKIPEAVATYQDIIQNSEDKMLSESARWHINNLRWQQQMDVQLKRLREIQQKPEIDTGDSAPAPANPGGT